jgi:hypothetical protein
MALSKTQKEIVENLRKVSKGKPLSRSAYRNSARRAFASSTIETHFGSFSKAVKSARIPSA